MRLGAKDRRINARAVSGLEIAGIFLAMIAFNGTHIAIYHKLQESGLSTEENPQLFVNVLGGYVLLAAALMTLFVALTRHYVQGRPMRRLSEAARHIAAGDFSVRLPPLRKDGKKDYVEVMFEDFNKMAEELSTIETLKNDFIGNVSHEIKTPLSVILNAATLLQRESLSPAERREYTATIMAASQRLTSLVSNILKLNKLENQEIVPLARPFDLSEQLRQCVLGFEEMWENKAITLCAEIEDDVTVSLDPAMLEIVWNNLLSNALKFTEPGGWVEVALWVEEEAAVVRVSDTGCGLDEAVGNHIFDKFYQGDTSHSGEGNGLGLALVKRIIDLLGGEITVDSKKGQGSSFTVRLDTGQEPSP